MGKNIGFFLGFLILLIGFVFFIFNNTTIFFILFIIVSFGDIIAYFIGKHIPWKKGFSQLSPNKSLSGVIAQIFFISIVASMYFLKYIHGFSYSLLIFIAIILGFLGPIGDLTESYFKRKAHIKDMANYIPGHGGTLDRIDSIFFSGGIIGLFSILLYFI